MTPPDAMKFAEFEEAEAIRDGGLALLCRVNGRDVWIPIRQLAVTGAVQKVGDRGKLVIPTWLALGLGLINGSDGLDGATRPRRGSRLKARSRTLSTLPSCR